MLTKPQLLRDFAVEFVLVNGVDASGQDIVTLTQIFQALIVKGFFFLMTVLQGLLDGFHVAVGDTQSVKGFDKLFRDGLFANVLIPALSLAVAAVIIDVLFLLNLGRNRAAAVSTSDEASEGKVLLGLLGAIGLIEHLLYLFKQRQRDNGRMFTVVELPVHNEITGVKHVVEQVVKAALVNLGL